MTEPHPHESPATPGSQVDDALGSGDEPPAPPRTGPDPAGAFPPPPEPHEAPPTSGSRVDDELGSGDEPGRAPPGGGEPPMGEQFSLGEMPIGTDLSAGPPPPTGAPQGAAGAWVAGAATEPALPDAAGATPSNPLIWRGMWHVPRYLGGEFWRAWIARATVLLIGVALLATAFIAAYVGGLHEPTARDIPVAVVHGDTTSEQVLTVLDQRTTLVTGRVYANAGDAHSALNRREVFAVLASDGSGLHLTTSSGAGQAATQVVAAAVGAVADANGLALTTTDAHPLTTHDPRGLTAFYLVVGLTVGGYLAATVLGLSLGTAPRDLSRAAARFGGFAAFSLVLGFVAAILVGPVFNVWADHLLGITLGGALVSFAAASITSALQGWLGLVGTGLAILLLVVLGNPGSGGIFPWPFLPGFFRNMHVWVPAGLGTDLVRAIAYYHRAAAGWPITILLLWTVAGVLGTLGATLSRGRRGEHAL